MEPALDRARSSAPGVERFAMVRGIMAFIDEPTLPERVGAWFGIVFSVLCYLSVIAVLISQFAR